MATETDVIEVRFKATADGAVVAAYDKIAAASTKTEATIKKFDAANDNAFKRLNDGASKGVRALGSFANAASQAEPALGKFAATAAQAAGTITQFGMYMGTGGPWGVAMAAGVGALAILTAGLNENKISADEARKSNEAFAKAQMEQSARAAESRASNDPYLKALQQRRNAEPPKSADEALAESYRAETERAEAAANASGKVYDSVGDGGRGGKRADAEFQAAQRRSENERRMRALDAADAESRARVASADAMMAGRGFEDPSKAGDATRAKLDAEFDLQREHNERMKSTADEINEHYAKLDEQAAARAQLTRDTAGKAFGAVASSAASALNKMAAGQKASLKEFIGGIGQALVAQGTADLARAGAMLFIPGLQGNAGGLAAAAAVEIAVGMGMGAAGASGGGGGGGGARGPHANRGESGGEFLDRTRAASPTTSRSSSGGSGGTTVVNVHMPTVISPSVEDGIRIKHALREAQRAGV